MQETLGGEGTVCMHVVTNAEPALSFIRRSDRYADAPIPDLVLLDLGLPDDDGLTVLRRLRGVSQIPVVVLTARDDERSVVRALRLLGGRIRPDVVALVRGGGSRTDLAAFDSEAIARAIWSRSCTASQGSSRPIVGRKACAVASDSRA